MSDLVGNPEDRFSHNEAHMIYKHNILDNKLQKRIPQLIQIIEQTVEFVIRRLIEEQSDLSQTYLSKYVDQQ